jgi:hypothetical protein
MISGDSPRFSPLEIVSVFSSSTFDPDLSAGAMSVNWGPLFPLGSEALLMWDSDSRNRREVSFRRRPEDCGSEQVSIASPLRHLGKPQVCYCHKIEPSFADVERTCPLQYACGVTQPASSCLELYEVCNIDGHGIIMEYHVLECTMPAVKASEARRGEARNLLDLGI